LHRIQYKNRLASCSVHHATAFFRTPLACLGAPLAMLHFMLGTFIGADLANTGAYMANLADKFTAACHIARSDAADLCTVHVEFDAPRHHLDVLFIQTGRSAMVAFCGAGITGIDTRLKFFM
jgi:hypothetical protein